MKHLTRRQFNRAVVGASAALAAAGRSSAASSKPLRAGWIGTGAQGGHDIRNFLQGCENVELAALADVLPERVQGARRHARNVKNAKGKVTAGEDDCYLGFDAYKKVMEREDIDLVILTTPPGFRPQMVEAAVDAGKHLFFEKPAAVDAPGVRRIIAAGEKAKRKGLSIVVGTQQRRMPHYVELIRRVHAGQIGDIVAAQAYWHWGYQNWHFSPRDPKWSDVEWQIRCWPYFTWLSGDHVVEQHCHNLDIINWAVGTHPEKCMARGGRQARTGEHYGNIYDHFSGELTYPGGVRLASFSSQIAGATGLVGERLVGTKGQTWSDRGRCIIKGENEWTYEGPRHDGGQKQFQDLCHAIRTGEPVNEARQIAESTLVAIMVRMGAYTGRALSWKWAMEGSKEDLSPEKPLDINGDLPVRPVRIPGKTKLT